MTRLADDAWSAMADPSQLSSAIVNLAVNARDAMPGGGRLTLETANRELDGTSGAGDGDVMRGAFVMIAVADTGHGITADIRERVFEPFFTTKGVGRGTGLGLSMVHGLAAQSGGRLAIESRPGLGTAVEVWLPMSLSAALVGMAGTPGRPDEESEELLILAVDDDPLVLTSTSALLEDLGHRVLQAHSGAEALEAIRHQPQLDLLITDQVMPGMTGLQLSTAAREARPDLAVLIVTGFAELPDDVDPDTMRLPKPFTQNDLATAIDRAFAPAPDGRRTPRSD